MTKRGVSPRGKSSHVDRDVGQRIRTRRELLNKKRKNVAVDLGITYQQLQKYESGENRVSLAMLFEIAQILECAPAELVGSGLEMPKENDVVLRLMADPHLRAGLLEIPKLSASAKISLSIIIREMAKNGPTTDKGGETGRPTFVMANHLRSGDLIEYITSVPDGKNFVMEEHAKCIKAVSKDDYDKTVCEFIDGTSAKFHAGEYVKLTGTVF